MSRNAYAFSSQSELVEKLSESIAKQLQDAIDENGKASLLVSGGSTPKPLFEKLRKSNIEWDKVTVGLCDERWVPSSDDDSNEKLVKTYLLQENAANASFVGMYVENMEAVESEKICMQNMRESLSPFDVIVLGMGNDAHTASLFPNNERLEEAFDLDSNELCIAIKPERAPHMRMSLTLAAILSAKHIYLHIEGEEKLNVYHEAVVGENMYEMPIRSILNQDIKDVEVYFYE